METEQELDYELITRICLCILLLITMYVCVTHSTTTVISNGNFIVKGSELLQKGERGLFANKDYLVGEAIEHCPTLLISENDINYPNKINDYVFQSHIDKHVLIPFGYCGLINHSNKKQNCSWSISDDNSTITMYAIRNIRSGEEIYVSYGEEYWSERKISGTVM